MAEHCLETESQILGLQSNEDEIHEEGQSSSAHYGGQRYPCVVLPMKIHGRGFKQAIQVMMWLMYSCPSGRHKPQSYKETKTLHFCNPDTKNFEK